MTNKIKAICLFSGCGGADLGLLGGFEFLNFFYPKTQVEIVHASDINEKAVATYNLNFDHKAVVADINNLNFGKNAADIILGGFPCQPFSSVNPTKRPQVRENQLFWQMAKIIKRVQPKVFIAENVKGFYTLEGGRYFQLATKEFSKLGYIVHHKLIDASDYGIPQKRQRLFIIGIKKTIRISFEFPSAIYGEGKIPKVPLSAVIKDIVPSNPKYYFSKRAVEGVKKAKPNMKRALAQDLNEQCLTITSHLAKVSLNSRDPVLLVNKKRELYRRFTPREAARIQSFPELFLFSGSEADAYRQIGNAVPPVLMWYLSESILRQVFGQTALSKKVVRERSATGKVLSPLSEVLLSN